MNTSLEPITIPDKTQLCMNLAKNSDYAFTAANCLKLASKGSEHLTYPNTGLTQTIGSPDNKDNTLYNLLSPKNFCVSPDRTSMVCRNRYRNDVNFINSTIKAFQEPFKPVAQFLTRLREVFYSPEARENYPNADYSLKDAIGAFFNSLGLGSFLQNPQTTER